MHAQLIAAFVLYFVVLLMIGLFAHKKSTTAADFIMGNRSLNYWLTALSAHASDMSAWLFMAFPMAIFVYGLPQLWMGVGLVVGMFLSWHFVAPKLRTATEQYDSYTLSTFFEKRFQDRSGSIRLISAFMLVVFMTHYLGAGLIATGDLFQNLFGIDYAIGITIATLVVIAYTFVGGFITVAWTDCFQALFLLLMISIVPIVAFSKVGSFEAIQEAAARQEIGLAMLPEFSLDTILTSLSLAVGWGIGYFGMPHVITKFMGIKSAATMYKAKYLGISWQILSLTAACFVGLIGIAFFPDGLARPEFVFVEMVKQLFTPFLAGIILCGVFAANLSTMDSQILVSASVLTEDFYKHVLSRREATSKQLLKATRVSVIIVALVALFIAYRKSASILETVSYSWSGLGSVFGPVVLTALYSKSANKYGVLVGMVVGGLASGAWPYVSSLFTEYAVMPMIPGFFLNLLTIFVVSALTKKRMMATSQSKHE
jgi:SSS family solute:Na+ symporter